MSMLDGLFSVARAAVSRLSYAGGAYDKQQNIAPYYSTEGDGGGGVFEWRGTSTSTADGGTVVAVSGVTVGRWHRLFSGAVYVAWFGPATDGVTDAAAKLRAAVAATPDMGELIGQDGATYLVSSSVTGSASITIKGNFTVKKGAFDGQCFKIWAAVPGVPLAAVTVDGPTFDGDDSGTIDYSLSTPNDELSIAYVTRVKVRRCTFVNTRCRSLVASTCTTVDFTSCDFENGAVSSGSASATTAFHSAAFFCTNLTVDRCTYRADITYDAGDKTQAGVVAAAPIALIATNCEYVTVDHLKSYDAGNVELYEACRNVIVADCHFDRCHLPAIKISNSQRAIVHNNTIIDPQHWWGYSVLVGCYTRLTTYGCLRPDQGQISITDNVITGSKSEYGAIFVQGIGYSTADLDTRISSQASYGYTTTNIVTKVGSDYLYTDFDGTQYAAMDQAYLLARNVGICGNTLDGFATTGIYVYLADTISILKNPMSNCASIDTTNGTTKACIKLLEFLNADVKNNVCTMPASTVPKVSGASSSVSGVIATTVLSTFRGVARLKCNDNTWTLTKCAYGVYIDDLKYASIQDNDFAMNSYLSNSSGSIVAAGNNRYGVIAGNQYWVADTGTVPSASTEYNNLQAHFMSLDFRDERRSIEISRRVVSASGDYTTPNQVAAGYYSLGSTITISGNLHSTYQRCSTAGHLAPAYAGGTTYAKGNKVVNGGEYFVSLSSGNLGHTPTAGTGDSYWEYLGATAAAFTAMTL